MLAQAAGDVIVLFAYSLLSFAYQRVLPEEATETKINLIISTKRGRSN